MTRSARTTTQDVWCGARPGSLISPNPPTQFMTFVGFRVFLPPKPPYQGGLAWSLTGRVEEAFWKAEPLRDSSLQEAHTSREGSLTGSKFKIVVRSNVF